jgi:hypothetical protein
VVRGAGLEPARYFYHEPLKLACLPFHHPRTDGRDASAALVIISWPRSLRSLVHQITKFAAAVSPCRAPTAGALARPEPGSLGRLEPLVRQRERAPPGPTASPVRLG